MEHNPSGVAFVGDIARLTVGILSKTKQLLGRTEVPIPVTLQLTIMLCVANRSILRPQVLVVRHLHQALEIMLGKV